MDLQDVDISQENFEIFQPIILVARLLGILPVQYVKNGSQYRLKKSLLYVMYSYALSIFLSIATVLGVTNDLEKDDNHSIRMADKKTRFITSSDISIIIIIVLFSTITLPQRLKNLWKLLHQLNQTDSIIPLKKQNRFRQSSLFFMATTFVLSIILFTFDIVVWTNSSVKKINNSTSFFKNYTTFYVIYFIVVTQEILFWHFVLFIKIRIGALNQQLRNLGKGDKSHRNLSEQGCGSNNTLGQVLVGNGLQKIEVSKGSKTKNCLEKLTLVEKITVLTKYQETIFHAVQSVGNDGAYGIQLIMLSCLLHLIVTPYFLLTELMKTDINVLFACLQTAWFLAHVGRLLIIVEPCQLCLDEGRLAPKRNNFELRTKIEIRALIITEIIQPSQHRRTSVLVCQLLTDDFEEDIKKSLMIFAMQLDYCKIKFSPCGFFTIDRSLMTSVSAAVTTYLVILFQFSN